MITLCWGTAVRRKNRGMDDLKPVQFPCESLPENPSQARLLGIYPQRPAGLFMQRVKAPAGTHDLGAVAGIGATGRPIHAGYPLHVTTRQNIELHGVRKEDLPAVQRGIDSLGLTGAAACGDACAISPFVPAMAAVPAHGTSAPWSLPFGPPWNRCPGERTCRESSRSAFPAAARRAADLG